MDEQKTAYNPVEVAKAMGTTIADLAIQHDVAYSTMYSRLSKTGQPEAAPRRIYSKSRDEEAYQGKSLVDWAEELGLTLNGLKYRIARHGIEKAVSKPKGRLAYSYKGRTIAQWADDLGVSYTRIYLLIKTKEMTPGEAVEKVRADLSKQREKEFEKETADLVEFQKKSEE